MIKAICFDIGGTLLDSSKESSVVQQISMLSNVSIDLVKSAYKEHFITKQISIEEFCEKTQIKHVTDLLEAIEQYYKMKPLAKVWEDVPSALMEIKRRNMTIVAISNKSYRNPNCLKTYGLQQWFSEEIYSYDIGYAKPNIAIFNYVQSLLKLNPNEILHVGDSLISDYFGAKAACWNSVLLDRYKTQIPVKGKDISVIYSLNELPNYINKHY